MSDKSGIEWTEATWNPVTGCDRVSEGCDHCYAQTLAKRLKAMGNPRYQHDGDARTSGPGFGLTLHEDVLGLPRRWGRGRVVFVNSMSDLFHDQVPDTFIADVFRTMQTTPRHQYQVLTKRPGRMASLFIRWQVQDELRQLVELPNVWLGTSVEMQKWADIRIPQLLRTPAAVRFLSCEPLLGPVNLGGVVNPRGLVDISGGHIRQLDWVIVGGESGPGARPMNPQWARSIRDQCKEAGVPYFFKQWGGRTPTAGGRDLDGRTWDEMPRSEAKVHLV